jgi:selenocysteine lyase/cysteine desulfurase
LKPYELPKSAKRFEYGTLNFGGIYAFHDSLSYLNKIGINNVEKRVLELSSYLRSRLNDLGAELFTPENTNSPIISVFVKNAQEIGEKLRKKRVKVTTRDWNDNGYFRVSVHFYNTREDIDVFIEELEMMIRDDQHST